MKNKDRKEIAKKIAAIERNLGDSPTPEAKREAEEKIMSLCARVTDVDDIFIIDEMVQEILKKSCNS
jgi:hypothetical protein